MIGLLATRLSQLRARIRQRLRASSRPSRTDRPSISARDLRLPMGELVPVRVRVRHTTARRTRT